METLERLNGVVRGLAEGNHVFTAFCPPDVRSALGFSASRYHGIVFEMEHNPWDLRSLRDAFQYLLDRRQIVASGSLRPAVTPLVRIPPNGSERAQWHAKQALDIGAYGIVWPRISTVGDAKNAVAACRYPRASGDADGVPVGVRGDGPFGACRYWGLSQEDYYERADVWPAVSHGEILVIVMIETVEGVRNLRDILREVPGIGVVLIGEGDLSQELGHPRQYGHPAVVSEVARVLAACQEAGVVVGHAHVTVDNVEKVIEEGYRFLMAAPARTYPALERGLELTDRGQRRVE